MYIFLRQFLRRFLALFGLGLVTRDRLVALEQARIQRDNILAKLPFILEVDTGDKWGAEARFEILKESKSESGQDLFAILTSNFKEGGVFLEFGAYNGVDFSNTFLLEKVFGWTGLLVEPIPRSFKEIEESRTSLAIHGAVTSIDTDSITVFEMPASNLSKLASLETQKNRLRKGICHTVRGYSINTLMKDHLSRREIDFLSIDVEGSEFEILEKVDFDYFKFGAICVEHNFSPSAKAIRNLLENNGYVVQFEKYSGNDFWFINSSNENLKPFEKYFK